MGQAQEVKLALPYTLPMSWFQLRQWVVWLLLWDGWVPTAVMKSGDGCRMGCLWPMGWGFDVPGIDHLFIVLGLSASRTDVWSAGHPMLYLCWQADREWWWSVCLSSVIFLCRYTLLCLQLVQIWPNYPASVLVAVQTGSKDPWGPQHMFPGCPEVCGQHWTAAPTLCAWGSEGWRKPGYQVCWEHTYQTLRARSQAIHLSELDIFLHSL